MDKKLVGTYIKSDGRVVYNNVWSWLVVFQSMSKLNYAIVKFYNGKCSFSEL